MGRGLNKLTAMLVKKLTAAGYYGDGGGLWLRISTAQTKSWVFRFTLDGRTREMGLGSVHTNTLAEAREKANACRRLLEQKIDPISARDATKTVRAMAQSRRKTFDQCAAAYIAAHRGTWKSEKHAGQWEATLKTYASPTIGQLPVADIDTDLVVRVLRPLWAVKTETATRLRGRIESILDWAAVSGLRQGENPARWRGHLDHLLGNPEKIAPVRNHPALPWQELPVFIRDLRTREGTSARATEFAILTACRSGEVRGARWSEIDLTNKLWVVPAARMKAGKEHRVPLSTAAVALLGSLSHHSELVFEGAKRGAPLSDMSLTAVLRRMGRGDITIHGFRSTFRDWCAEAEGNNFPREVCEHALAHSLPDKVEAAYRRGDLLDKRAILMERWAIYAFGLAHEDEEQSTAQGETENPRE
jgi:integrase